MRELYTILFLFLISYAAQAADFYWKGGSGNYNDINKWELNFAGSGLTPLNSPLSTDNVFFPASAFTSPNDTITVDGPSNCLDMIWDNAITVANAPVFIDISTTPVGNTTLDIYGSLYLATNMKFDFRGMLRFRSVSGGAEEIETKGHKLLLRRVEFDGASTTEWQLQDDLYLDDVNEYTTNTNTVWDSPGRQATIVLKRGIFNTNGMNLRTDFFHSVFTNADRGLNIENSRLLLSGRAVGSAYAWNINFDASTSNYSLFSASGSHLILDQDGIYGEKVGLGGGIAYDSLTAYNSLTMQGGVTPVLFNYMNVPYYTAFYLNLDVTDLYWGAGSTYDFIGAASKGELTVENIHLPAICDKFTRVKGSNNLRGLLRKKSVGTLTLNNCILENMDCDIAGGRAYVANSSIDGGGNQVDWTINSPTSRDMYFRDYSGDQNWHDANNWEIWDGFAFQPNVSGCIPNPADDVFFDGASFPNANKWVQVDSGAYCNNMRWLPTVAVGAQWKLNETIFIYGTMQLHSNMQNMTGYSIMMFYGNKPDSIITDGVTITEVYLQKYSDYHLIGNTTCNGDFTGFIYSTVHADNLDLTCRDLTLANRELDSVQVYIDATNFFDAGGTMIDYTGTTTFHFRGGGSIVRAQRFYPYNNTVTLPNIIAYNTKLLLEGIDCYVEGDLYFHENGEFRSSGGVEVTGTMALYSGKVTMTAGKTYSIRDLSIADSLLAIGDCKTQITLEPYGVAVGQISLVDATKAILDYCFVRDLNNIGPTITSLTSTDGGNNTNFAFTLGSGVTYYWRANAGDATNFVGNWTDADHWTTNPSDLVGTLGGCIPTLVDTVIFDSQSFSGASNGCTVAKSAFCKTLICRDDITLDGSQVMYIGESFHLYNNMTNYNYIGNIYFIGTGTANILDPNNTAMPNAAISFQNDSGVWSLANDLVMTGTANNRLKGFFMKGGTFNSNDYDITIDILSFQATGGTLNMGTSTIDMLANGFYSNYYGYLWVMSDTSKVNWNAENTIINFNNNTSTASYDKELYMGNGQEYNRVNFYETDETTILIHNAIYNYAYFEGTANILGNNYFDSLRLNGGAYYYLNNGSIQTLAPVHGKIITNGSAGNFVYIETIPSGGTSYFHKEYGTSFCVDYVKVKDNEATKGAVPPAGWAAAHPFLRFETGINSDNINGTAAGIWAFNLPPILTIASSHADSIEFCNSRQTVYLPMQLTGTYPYSIIYSWTDILGGSGTDTVIVTDDDADVTTVFNYDLALSPVTTTSYTIDVGALRCGGRYYNAPVTNFKVKMPSPKPLVAVDREASCYLNNSPEWVHFMDDVNGKPILSLLDSTSTADTDSLLNVNIGVDFDATVQWWNAKPYLQRTWKVDPTNNVAGKVRLYFTQEELDSLGVYTFDGVAPIPSTELVLWKFPDTVTVGVPVQVPFTVIPLSGAVADPFSATTDVYAIEFEVSSFSGFMLQPTDAALLPVADLLSFDARLNTENTTELDWEVNSNNNLAYFVIERSEDGIAFEEMDKVIAYNKKLAYGFVDLQPLVGNTYYRLRLVDVDGRISYSRVRTVYMDGVDVIEIFPIPNNGVFTIRLESTSAKNLSIQLWDQLGRRVYETEKSVNRGINQLEIQTIKLSNGVYYLQLRDEYGLGKQQKMIIER
ncbi:MAG: T9SS type A sorting domain-containing protein [Aureispira sp.]|nr:T9SS type A sorting domain-containing protein [Aureispira sp.]